MTFLAYLEELTDAERAVSISANDVERLVERFGDRVRNMGRWNASGDGGLQIPVSVIHEAAARLGSPAVSEAIQELKADGLAGLLQTSSAAFLIEKIAECYRLHFREMMTSYQNTNDPAETVRLREELVGEVFGE